MATSLFRPLARAGGLRRAIAVPAPVMRAPVPVFSTRVFSALGSGGVRKATTLFTMDHEYLHYPPSPSTLVTIGITSYAASTLGELVYIELPGVNSTIYAGESLGTVESVKSASEIMAPVTGVVKEINPKLANSPGFLNAGNAEDVGERGGWICKVDVEEGKGEVVEGLMDGEKYEAYKSGEVH